LALSWLLIGATEPGTVELELTGLRSAKGLVQVCLTRDAGRFPECGKDAMRSVPATQASFRIEGLPTGSYAVSLFHDENRNGRLDTTMGIPREGFGFSRNPPIRFGPPKFAAARFTVGSGETEQRVKLKYLL
jgi:uncharacterized protein (DUF2141 family)